MTPLATLEGVNRRLGRFTLDIPELVVHPGEVLGVVGPNGAGKTTLLRVLAGLDRPDAGTVTACGHDPKRDTVAVRQTVAYMSDDQALFKLRIDRLLRTLSGYWPTWDAALATSLLEQFRLDPTASPSRLSKGEGTRLRLLISLAWKPRLLLLDEPGTGLDLAGRRALLSSVLDVVAEPARGVVVSSHQLADVERIADRLVVMDQGRIVRQGPTDELVPDGTTLEENLLQWGVAG
jgi:ABC-2 type transport system ATP-binding protein